MARRLYYVEHADHDLWGKEITCGGFVMANNKEQAATSIPPRTTLTAARVAKQEDVDKHGGGRSREQIIGNIKKADKMIAELVRENRRR